MQSQSAGKGGERPAGEADLHGEGAVWSQVHANQRNIAPQEDATSAEVFGGAAQ